MKKFVLASIFSVVCLVASAQGCWVGGGLGFGYQSTKPDGGESVSSTTFSIAPEFGYNITDRFAIAAELEFDHTSTDGANVNTFGIGPYVRYTFVNGDMVNFFGELAGHYVNVKAEKADAIDGFNIQLRPGISVALNENWALTGKLSLLEFMQLSDKGYKVNSTGIRITTGLTVGFVYKF